MNDKQKEEAKQARVHLLNIIQGTNPKGMVYQEIDKMIAVLEDYILTKNL